MNQPVWLLWYPTANVKHKNSTTLNWTQHSNLCRVSVRCWDWLVGWLGKALAKPRGQCFEAFQTDPAIMNYNALRCFCCCHCIVCAIHIAIYFLCCVFSVSNCWIDVSFVAHTQQVKRVHRGCCCCYCGANWSDAIARERERNTEIEREREKIVTTEKDRSSLSASCVRFGHEGYLTEKVEILPHHSLL